jgi:hypothetical protein
MKIKVKINPKTRVAYVPKSIIEEGFEGEVDVYGAGSVIVIPHPNADLAAINESISLVARDIELTYSRRSRQEAHLPKSGRIKQNGVGES